MVKYRSRSVYMRETTAVTILYVAGKVPQPGWSLCIGETSPPGYLTSIQRPFIQWPSHYTDRAIAAHDLIIECGIQKSVKNK
jgi:hypothetical protein